jgi:hypothetical protein
MRFFSIQFPNLKVFHPRMDVQFNDGVLDTDDPEIIEMLKKSGFEHTGVEDATPEPPKKKAKR